MIGTKRKLREPFSVKPTTISFSKYLPCEKYIKKITITNNDGVSHQLCVRFPRDHELSLNIDGDQKIAPGLNIILEVTFRPNINYEHMKTDRQCEIEIFCKSAKYQCLIPVLLLSPFSTCTFPKEITVPRTAVGIPTYSTMYVCNYGHTIQKFTISRPEQINFLPFNKKEFSLQPQKHEIILLEVTPNDCEDCILEMVVVFDTERTLKIPVKCNSTECEVYFENDSLEFPDTYLGYTSMLSTVLKNDSKFKVKYQFCAYKNEIQDHKFKTTVKDSYGKLLHYNYDRVNDVVYEGSISRDVHRCILDRQLLSYRNSDFIIPYQSNFFEIIPNEGEIYPKSCTMVNVVFHPPSEIPQSESGTEREIVSKAYLQYDSCQNYRPAFNFKGIALGPRIEFTVNEYHIGNIFCGETVTIQLQCKNKGLLDGEISFKSIESRSCSDVTVTPHCLKLITNEVGIFSISYKNNQIGHFMDILKFNVMYGDILKIALNGIVKPLTVQIIPSKVDFGEISICCRQIQHLLIKNILPCPITIRLGIEGYGNRARCSALSFDEFDCFLNRNCTPMSRYRPELTQITLDEVPSRVSSITSCDDIRTSHLNNSVLESAMGTLIFEYERLEKQSELSCKDSKDSVEQEMENRCELVKRVVSQIFRSVDISIEVHDLKEQIEHYMYKMIDIWIEDKQIIDQLLDTVLDDFLISLDSKPCQEMPKFITPFVTKDWKLHENAREYDVDPNEILLDAKASTIVHLNLIPNWPGPFKTNLVADIYWHENLSGSGDCAEYCRNTVTIPLSHNCVVPELVIEQDMIELDTMIGFECSSHLTIRNCDLNVDGFVYARPFQSETVEIICCPTKDIIPSGSCTDFELRVKPLIIGSFTEFYSLYTLGNDQKMTVSITCNSECLNVCAEPKVITSKNIPILIKYPVRILLKNNSPVKVIYDVKMITCHQNSYSIEDYDHHLDEYEWIQITVNKYFNTPGEYEALCCISFRTEFGNVFKQQKIKIKTQAIGIPIRVWLENSEEDINFGTILFEDPSYPSEILTVENTSQILYHINASLSNETDLLLNSHRLEVYPHNRCTFEIKLNPKSPKRINDTLTLSASSSGLSKDFKQFATFNIKAEIIVPNLQFSKSNIVLDLKYGDDYDCIAFDTVNLTNHSSIDLKVICLIEGEYDLIDVENCSSEKLLEIKLAPRQSYELAVYFNTQVILANNFSRNFSGKLKALVKGKIIALVQLSTCLQYPFIEVEQTNHNIFQSQTSCFYNFNILNPSICLDAEYNWELVDGSFCFNNVISNHISKSTYSIVSQLSSNDINLVDNFFHEIERQDGEQEFKDLDQEELEIPPSVEIDLKEIPETVGKKFKRRSKSLMPEKRLRSMVDSTETEAAADLTDFQETKSIKSGKRTKKRPKSVQGDQESVVTNVESPIRKARKSKKREELSVIAEQQEEIAEEIKIELNPQQIQEELDKVWQFLEIKISPGKKLPILNSDLQEKLKRNDEDHQSQLTNLIQLDSTSGQLSKDTKRTLSMLIMKNEKSCTYSFTLRLNVKGGRSTDVHFKITNDLPHFELNKKEIDLGEQLWYTVLKKSFTIFNTSIIPLSINLQKSDFESSDVLMEGLWKLSNSSCNIFPDSPKLVVKSLVLMGLNKNFYREIAIDANERAPVLLSIKGSVRIPTATFFNCYSLNQDFPNIEEISIEYISLQKMYNQWCQREIRNNIESSQVDTKCKGKSMKVGIQETQTTKNLAPPNSLTSLNVIFVRDKNSSTDTNLELNDTMDGEMQCQTSVFIKEDMFITSDSTKCDAEPGFELNHLELLGFEMLQDSDAPQFWEIKTFLDHERLVFNIKNKSAPREFMEKFFKRHASSKFDKEGFKLPPKFGFKGKAVSFIIEPIHKCCLDVQMYRFDLGEMSLNEKTQKKLPLIFHGPGIFSASFRAEISIPGLQAKFEIDPKSFPTKKGIPFKYNLKEYVPVVAKGYRYTNRHNRDSCDVEEIYDLTHAHSHDFTKRLVHIRKPRTVKEMSSIKTHYNKINSKYKPIRDPFIYAEIFQETSRDASNHVFTIAIEFIPTAKYYCPGMLIDEVMYLDIHLGVSLPVLLQGKIAEKRVDCSCIKNLRFLDISSSDEFKAMTPARTPE